MDWYYDNNGTQAGPVPDAEIAALYASGAIRPDSLVWNESFGAQWKPAGSVGFPAPAQRVPGAPMPLPLPGQSTMPSARFAGPAPSGDAGEFMASPFTQAFVGPKYSHYATKWNTLLTKSGGNPTAAGKVTSWHWPAFFVPYAWLLYRKMYKYGLGLFLFQLVVVIVPDTISRGFQTASFGASVAVALYANAWYFNHTFTAWTEAKANPARGQAIIAEQGGVNPALAWGSVVLLIAIAIGSVYVQM